MKQATLEFLEFLAQFNTHELASMGAHVLEREHKQDSQEIIIDLGMLIWRAIHIKEIDTLLHELGHLMDVEDQARLEDMHDRPLPWWRGQLITLNRSIEYDLTAEQSELMSFLIRCGMALTKTKE